MSFLPNEIFLDMTNFLPNNDITDLMLLSRKFNAFVTPRLQKIDQEIATMNQTIESLMPSQAPNFYDNEWIPQLNLKRFEPIGSEAKKRMQKLFEDQGKFLRSLWEATRKFDKPKRMKNMMYLKEGMSLERFDDATVLRILGALIALPKFRQEYNVSNRFAQRIISFIVDGGCHYDRQRFGTFRDVMWICSYYNIDIY